MDECRDRADALPAGIDVAQLKRLPPIRELRVGAHGAEHQRRRRQQVLHLYLGRRRQHMR
jgi:hypothetical protein